MNVFSRQSGLFALGLLLVGSLIAAKFPTATKQYDYVSIVQISTQLQISGNQQPFQAIKIKETKYNDYQELFRKVNEFEAQGYELVESNTNGYSCYTLLRIPK
jgi:uncharacterized protein involved in exopolysaccharide biosynthesis